jgi:hypothetical protein
VGTTRLRRPPAPLHAERARSIAARGGHAALVGLGASEAVVPHVHHVRADGSAVMLLADGEPVLGHIREADYAGLATMLEITDPAPVDLRQPVRGLMWITGWLQLPDPASARSVALQVSEMRPQPEWLGLGHGATLVRLVPGSVVLSDAEGSAALSPVDLAAARPDPFARSEQQWLAHLEAAHPEVFTALTRHLPPVLRDLPDARVRPLGVDRCGLRLRVEAPDRDHDVRLAWDGGATTANELTVQLGRLLDCPLRARGSVTGRPRADGPAG